MFHILKRVKKGAPKFAINSAVRKRVHENQLNHSMTMKTFSV